MLWGLVSFTSLAWMVLAVVVAVVVKWILSVVNTPEQDGTQGGAKTHQVSSKPAAMHEYAACATQSSPCQLVVVLSEGLQMQAQHAQPVPDGTRQWLTLCVCAQQPCLQQQHYNGNLTLMHTHRGPKLVTVVQLIAMQMGKHHQRVSSQRRSQTVAHRLQRVSNLKCYRLVS